MTRPAATWRRAILNATKHQAFMGHHTGPLPRCRRLPVGTAALRLEFDAAGLSRIHFEGVPDRITATTYARVLATLRALRARGTGPRDLPRTASFRRAVWDFLQRIPPGATLTYGEIARHLGHPGAARAVGAACAANPLPLLVPCHRVVGSGGLGGFAGGTAWKRCLLAVEGALPAGGREKKGCRA